MCNRKFFDLISFIPKLGRNWKRRSEELGKMRARRNGGAMCAHSIPFLERKSYTQHTPPDSCADHFQRVIVQYESCRQEISALFRTRESVLQVDETNLNSKALRETVTQTLTS